jgi:hypothetical protein
VLQSYKLDSARLNLFGHLLQIGDLGLECCHVVFLLICTARN